MRFFVLAALIAVAAAQPSWYDGACGVSKYADAGEGQAPPFRDAAEMIVGGVQAREYEFPWQVSVQRASNNGHFCGGSLINTEWVLCAAHCMDGETPGAVEISAGDWDRSDDGSTVRQRLNVASIHVHENYNPNTYENDISLIKLATPAVFNADVQPVCAPNAANDYADVVCQCSGWGSLSSGGACCPAILRYVVMDTESNTFCNDAYNGDITADMICASDNNGGNDRDSCQGDSGGPLTIKDGNVFRLTGIVSWGIGCASGYPGVYSRVGYQEDWILNTMANN